MIGTDNVVYNYDVTSNTWTSNGPGPSLNGFSFVEALDGNLYACQNSTTSLQVRHLGTWSSITLPAACSVAGGVNAVAHEVYVKTYGSAGFSVINSLSNTVSRTITDGTSTGENTSSAAVLDGAFFVRSSDGNILRLDGTSGTRTDTGTDPTGAYDAMIGEPQAGVVFVKSDSGFSAYSPSLNMLTPLAAGPSTQSTLGTLTVTY
jgi:hypothetical protein